MTTIRTFMTEDHRHCDDLFADAEQAIGQNNLEAALAAFEHFHTAILAHFNTEEKTLFPTFEAKTCLLYTSPSPRDGLLSRMPSSA